MRLPTVVKLIPKSKKGWVILLFLNLPVWCAQGLSLYLYYCRSFVLWMWKACIRTTRSQDSSVNTVSRLWAWQLKNCSIPSSSKRLLFTNCPDWLWGLPNLLFSGYWRFFLRVEHLYSPPLHHVFMTLRGTALVYFLYKHSHVLLGFTESLVWKFMWSNFCGSFLIVFCTCISVGFWFYDSFIVY